MIYLDNAATSFPKPDCVIEKLNFCLKKYCGNPGRSGHSLSLKTSEKIYEARETVSSFLHLEKPENVIFTHNATQALNLAIKTTVKPDTHVLISDLEHNSVIRPLHALSNRIGVSYSIFETTGDVDNNISTKIRQNTKYIVSTLASNVIGREIDIYELSKSAKKHGLKLIIDASQLIGHKKIDLSTVNCSAFCAPSHKALFGIQGAGFCIFCDEETRDTLWEGGSGNDSVNLKMPSSLPEKFEAGTLPSPSIISMMQGIKYINCIGIDNIESSLRDMTENYAEVLRSEKNIAIYEYGNGIISFNYFKTPASTIADELNKDEIFVRSGLHCAPLAHKTNGTENIGAVRISLSYLNLKSDIDKFYRSIKRISKVYN